MAKSAKKILVEDVIEPNEHLEDLNDYNALRAQVDAKLDEAKGKFTAIAVVGVTEDGGFDLLTNVSQYSYIQWLLNKASFELFIHEKNVSRPAPEVK